MKKMKKIIAIVLCFSLLITLCINFESAVCASQKKASKRMVSILKKNNYYISEKDSYHIDSYHNKADRAFWIYFEGTKKGTNRGFNEYLKDFGHMVTEFTPFNVKMKRKGNTAWITIIEPGEYYYGILKKDLKKKRVIFTMFRYWQKHKPKAKKVKKQFKKQKKLLDKLMRQ